MIRVFGEPLRQEIPMATKPDAEHPVTEIGGQETSKEAIVVYELGSVSEDTHGCCGPHGEVGVPPFNSHT